MFLARKIGWAGIAFTLLTTGMLAQDFPRSPAGSDSNKEGVATVHQNEIKKMQENLRNKGHHRGEVDGVFGLRTRASIRAYQKAENLPITGQLDTRTADGLGVRPESNWGNSKESAGREVGHGGDRVGGEIKKDKPSAGIRRGEGRARKTWRREVSRASATEHNRGEGANKQQAENEKHDQ
jgi:peptidoglycan hydrolase-like protein with peptidoglycan-binding domain